MGALDKLNARAKKDVMEETAEKKEAVKETVAPAKAEGVKKAAATKTVKKPKTTAAATPKKKTTEKKHPGGRPNTRGNYKMVNVALSEDLYNRIQEVCMGNMTYYINDVLKKSVGM